MSNIILDNPELERRHKQFLAWSQAYMAHKALLIEKGFGGYIMKDNQIIETIIKEPYKQAIDDLDKHVQSKALELGLSTSPPPDPKE